MPHLSLVINMGAFHQIVFGMTTTAVLVELFSNEWIEINEYPNKQTQKNKQTKKQKTKKNPKKNTPYW